MKKPLCPTHNIPMEPSATILINKRRRITSEHTCPECGYDCQTAPEIINNAARPPSPSRPKPKQRMRFKDAMAIVKKKAEHNWRKKHPGQAMAGGLDHTELYYSDFHDIIKKLTR